MSVILRHFPLMESPQTVSFQGSELIIKPNQLPVWISLSENKKMPGGRPFPALIDTGFGYTFAILVEQLNAWSRLYPNYHSRSVRLNGVHCSRAPRVFLWLYRSWSPSAHGLANEKPILLDTDGIGIAVNTQIPTNGASAITRPFPRIPIIGMKTLRQNQMCLFVDAWRSRFSLYQGRVWPWQW